MSRPVRFEFLGDDTYNPHLRQGCAFVVPEHVAAVTDYGTIQTGPDYEKDQSPASLITVVGGQHLEVKGSVGEVLERLGL